MKIDKLELVIYEAPVWADFISNSFLQDLVSKYIAQKIERKYQLYIKRKKIFNLK